MNKSRRALVLAPALAYFCACCLGREGVRSDTEVRGILTEVTKLTPQVEDLLDRMVVLLRLGLANWKSGDSTSAKLNFDEAVKLIDDFPPQEQFADFYRQSIAEARMEVGDVEGADRTLAQIKDDSQRSAGFWTVGLLQARRVVKNGHEKEALAWATTQILPSDRALALIGIADALITGMQSVETRQ